MFCPGRKDAGHPSCYNTKTVLAATDNPPAKLLMTENKQLLDATQLVALHHFAKDCNKWMPLVKPCQLRTGETFDFRLRVYLDVLALFVHTSKVIYEEKKRRQNANERRRKDVIMQPHVWLTAETNFRKKNNTIRILSKIKMKGVFSQNREQIYLPAIKPYDLFRVLSLSATGATTHRAQSCPLQPAPPLLYRAQTQV